MAAGKAHAWIAGAAAGKPKQRRISKLTKGTQERLVDSEPGQNARIRVWGDAKEVEEAGCETCDIEMGGNGGQGREGGASGGKFK